MYQAYRGGAPAVHVSGGFAAAVTTMLAAASAGVEAASLKHVVAGNVAEAVLPTQR